MLPSVFLEVCVDSVASAVASEKGGAQRVELCSGLAEGGVTPSAGLIAMARKRISIALHVLIRPRPGDFCYLPDEFEVMKTDIVLAKQLGAAGVVLGILNPEGHVDVARTGELVELARPMSVTFHRAFDTTPGLPAALEEVVSTGADRVSTSGGAQTAEDGAAMIGCLVAAAADRVAIMACGAIRAGNVAGIVERTGVVEVHANLQSPVSSGEGRRMEVLPETVAGFLAAAAKLDPRLNRGR
ncbi:MAG: copper homeostasis protein CutC [Terriglobales bacterium]